MCSTQGTADLSLSPVLTSVHAPTPRRKRGRPKRDQGSLLGGERHTPSSQDSVTGQPARRRGRPKAGSNAPAPADRHPLSSQDSVASLAPRRRGRPKSALAPLPEAETQPLTSQDLAVSPLERGGRPRTTGDGPADLTPPSSTPSRQSSRIRTP